MISKIYRCVRALWPSCRICSSILHATIHETEKKRKTSTRCFFRTILRWIENGQPIEVGSRSDGSFVLDVTKLTRLFGVEITTNFGQWWARLLPTVIDFKYRGTRIVTPVHMLCGGFTTWAFSMLKKTWLRCTTPGNISNLTSAEAIKPSLPSRTPILCHPAWTLDRLWDVEISMYKDKVWIQDSNMLVTLIFPRCMPYIHEITILANVVHEKWHYITVLNRVGVQCCFHAQCGWSLVCWCRINDTRVLPESISTSKVMERGEVDHVTRPCACWWLSFKKLISSLVRLRSQSPAFATHLNGTRLLYQRESLCLTQTPSFSSFFTH